MPQSILFDWSLSILDEKSAQAADLGSQFWALTALREGMAAMDVSFIRQWAAAVFTMCERLLDSEHTPAALLPPLLGVTSQVHTDLCPLVKLAHCEHDNRLLPNRCVLHIRRLPLTQPDHSA